MSKKFHNPYHFVPVARTARTGPEIAGFPASLPAEVTHAEFVPGTRSGRLICRLQTVTPLVIGAAQKEKGGPDGSTLVEPFGINGEIAIPGSSLRGLISATAEAASNSTLRVLEEKWDRFKNGLEKSGNRSNSSAVAEFKNIDPDLVPLGKSTERQRLTAAELLFGFVENREGAQDAKKPDAKTDRQALALASRVRFSHALAAQEVKLLPPVRLRELSSPKPPRASFYFQPVSTAKIPSAKAPPKGRKFYLAHGEQNAVGWASQRTSGDRQLAVTPIPEKTVFWFHIDFDNLTPEELQLLCYALKPSAAYVHRLGLGKPLGLGLVLIDFCGLFLIDRSARYGGSDASGDRDWCGEPRFHESWVSGEFSGAIPERVRQRYAAEVGAMKSLEKANEAPEELAGEYRALALVAGRKDILQSLEMLGDRKLVRHPVHYPALVTGDLETNLYQWFARVSQYLEQLPNGGNLPELDRAIPAGGSGGGGAAAAGPPPPASGGGSKPKPVGPADLRQRVEALSHSGFARGKQVTLRARQPEKKGRVPFDILVDDEPLADTTAYAANLQRGLKDTFKTQFQPGTYATAKVVGTRDANGGSVVDVEDVQAEGSDGVVQPKDG